MKTGSGEGLVKAVQTMYIECDARVKTGKKHSEWFKVDQGMRQGCSLSPWLFNVFLDTIMKEARGLHEKNDIREIMWMSCYLLTTWDLLQTVQSLWK